ncbi:MAG: hypothetical protein JO031_00895, partial [Ktedonobacteraceae bacterium]|nr:hypothetical protein [Ktedonobacteraceae bacterium]
NAKATSWKSIALTVGVIAGIVLLVISLFAVAIRGRRRKKKAPVPPGGQQASAQPQNFRPGYPVTPPALGPINNNRAASVAPPRGPQLMPGQPGPIQTPPGQVFPGRPAPGQHAGLAQGPGAQNTAQQETLRPWPCGHMNRLNARFCSVCGELAPQSPTIRRVEQ